MDANKEAAIEKIFRLTLQDAEFDAALGSKLKIAYHANNKPVANEKIDEIYELCIEKITRKQGEEFYADFPIAELRTGLAEDYNRMERFRRKDDFFDFCLAMYQQIENITNKICSDPVVERVASKMWSSPAYLRSGKGITPKLDVRTSDYQVARLVFKGIPNSSLKTSKKWSELYALDKIRTVVYFVGYKAMMKYSDYDSFNEICDLLYELYQCRNTNHRGAGNAEQYDKSKQTLEKITPIKSFYYSKFHGALSRYVEYIKKGYPLSAELVKYADGL